MHDTRSGKARERRDLLPEVNVSGGPVPVWATADLTNRKRLPNLLDGCWAGTWRPAESRIARGMLPCAGVSVDRAPSARFGHQHRHVSRNGLADIVLRFSALPRALVQARLTGVFDRLPLPDATVVRVSPVPRRDLLQNRASSAPTADPGNRQSAGQRNPRIGNSGNRRLLNGTSRDAMACTLTMGPIPSRRFKMYWTSPGERRSRSRSAGARAAVRA